jgi:putative membrane protein
MATSACAQPYGRYGDRMMGPGYHGFWGMGWMALLFWALIVIVLVLLIRWAWQVTADKKSSVNSGNRALEILKERYAKGEIDKAQFDRIKKDLEA